jgi:hypothetical protein
MTPGLLSGAALAAAILFMVGSVAVGVFGFRPERAKAIRDGEAADPVVIEEIRRIHVAPPDRFHRGRIDRHPFYLAPHAAAFGYAISILAGAPITSNLAALSPGTKFTMASCFLVGAVLALCGAVMGIRVWQWDVVAGVREHIAASRLGDDIRLPYTFAVIAMCAMGLSTGIYASTSFGSTWGSLGGWLTGCIAGACAVMGVVFYRRTRQYSRTLKVVVDQAVANVIRRGGHDVE